MSNDKDFKVKSGIQPTVYHEGLGTVVSGSVGYSLGSASYDSVSFSVASEDTIPYQIAFNNDGTKLFMLGIVSDKVHQYTLSTAFDISTASYDSVSFSVSSQETDAYGLAFNNDGTKMYIVGNSSNSVFQYSLSTGFDISTASYNSVSLNVNSQDSIPTGIAFNNTGSKLYMIGQSSDKIHQYSLSTTFDLSTASYDSVDFSIASEETSPMDIAFNNDGTKMYMLGASEDKVHQYTLSTAFDISTASYDNVSFSVNSQDSNPRGVVFNNDGTKMYIVGNASDNVHAYSTVLTTAELDLSTGSVFEVTSTSDIQVTLSNPADSGTVSQGTLLLSSEDPTGVSSAFSTTLYTGTGSTQTITNGIDLAGDGGMVWIKSRTTARYPTIVDTERGPSGGGLFTAATDAPDASTNYVSQFNSDGFQVENYAATNESGQDLVSWSFKKQASFFDVVTYSGTGVAGRTISHNLNSEVGCIIIKRTDSTSAWTVYHRGMDSTAPEDYAMYLNATGARTDSTVFWNDTAPTSTDFTVSNNNLNNGNGATYVAYVFAHDTSANSTIKCGSYTGTGNGVTMSVDLGWSPQWIMIKRTDGATDWRIIDNVRGIPDSGNAPSLRANSTGDEQSVFEMNVTDTGFSTSDGSDQVNISGGNYIYVAIRNPSASTITYDSAIQFGGGTAPDSPAIGETDVLAFSTRDGGTSYQAMQAIDGAK